MTLAEKIDRLLDLSQQDTNFLADLAKEAPTPQQVKILNHMQERLHAIKKISDELPGAGRPKCPSCGERHLLVEPGTEVALAAAHWLEDFVREPDDAPTRIEEGGPFYVNAVCLISRLEEARRELWRDHA